jgi:hypothetical protein
MVVSHVFTCLASRVTSCRYFVLDSGYLTYYLDELKEPPYGKDRKGQVCLAGYRVEHSGTPGQGETPRNAAECTIVNSGAVPVARGTGCCLCATLNKPNLVATCPVYSAGVDGRRGGPGVSVPHPAGPHGRLFPGTCVTRVDECCGQLAMRGGGSMCVACYRLGHRCSVYFQCLLLNATRHAVKLPSRCCVFPQERAGKSEYEELMVEAATLEEKQAWVAALNAHTQYVEASLTAVMQLENREVATTAATPGTAAVKEVL